MSVLSVSDSWDGAVKLATILSPVLLAWIAYLQLKNGGVIKTLEKNTNSIKDALVKVTGEKAHAEGVLEGKAEARGQAGEKSVDVETQIVKKQIVEKQEKP